MEGHLKPIGGEFWLDKSLFNYKNNNFHDVNGVFLNGGQSAIEFILTAICINEDEYVLMPSYLCPTILYNFKREKIKILFYKINLDLSIDLQDMKDKICNYAVKAIFFINYFGFYHNNQTIEFLKAIKQKGIILIEDAVQMFWFNKMGKFIGDYVFNSYRKFLPIDGSIVLCDKLTNFNPVKDNYYNLVKRARTKKTKYIKSHIGKEEEFLKLFTEAEVSYYNRDRIFGMNSESKKILNNVNFELIKQSRRDNYNYLFDKLKNLNEINVIFNKKLITDNVPLALPVILNKRDNIRKKLREYNIYCPVHWDIRNEYWIGEFQESRRLSNYILTIPIDWRYNKEDIDYLIDKLTIILNSEV